MTFGYDAAGSLISNSTKTYEWDGQNRLVRVLDSGTEVARFAYDGFGRRAQKVSGGVTRTYVYGGDDILEERLSSGSTIRYVHGPGIDRPLASVDGAGSVSYYVTDHLGSIVQTTNSSAVATLVRQYDAYGNLLAGGTISGYAFTGREWDAETALYYYRARYYDPKLGRFVSEDPLSFVDGPNLHAYVLNSPLVYSDPSGLKVVNNSPHPTLVKGEGMGEGFVCVLPGQTHEGDVDGVKPPAWQNDWYKVPDGTDVTVNPDGTPTESAGKGRWIPDAPDCGSMCDRFPGRKKNPDWEQRRKDWKFPPDDPARDPAPRDPNGNRVPTACERK